MLPLHLLWINLVTDGLPGLALVMDPADADTLRRPPRPPAEPLLGRREWRGIVFTGAARSRRHPGRVRLGAAPAASSAEARDLAFNTLVFSELFRAFAARSPTRLFWQVGVFNNLRLVGVVVVSAFIQIGIHQIPAVARLFQIQDLPLETRALPFLLALIPVTVLELRKLVRRPA